MEIQKIDSKDPKAHAKNLCQHITDLKNHFREDIRVVDDPRAKALFETSAEVLGGLEKALKDFQLENEEAWKDRTFS